MIGIFQYLHKEFHTLNRMLINHGTFVTPRATTSRGSVKNAVKIPLRYKGYEDVSVYFVMKIIVDNVLCLLCLNAVNFIVCNATQTLCIFF